MKLQAFLFIAAFFFGAGLRAAAVWDSHPECLRLENQINEDPNSTALRAEMTRLYRELFDRNKPNGRKIQTYRKKIEALKKQIASTRGSEAADKEMQTIQLELMKSIYSRYSEASKKYYRLHPSWTWRKYQTERNRQFGKRLERAGVALLELQGVEMEPRKTSPHRTNGVMIVPLENGSYFNKLAFQLKTRYGVQLAFAPVDLMVEGTEAAVEGVPPTFFMPASIIRDAAFNASMSHEVMHLYLEWFGDHGLGTPFDLYLWSPDDKTPLSDQNTGYDDWLHSQEVMTYAHEAAMNAIQLKTALAHDAGVDVLRSYIELVRKQTHEAAILGEMLVSYSQKAEEILRDPARDPKAIEASLGDLELDQRFGAGYVSVTFPNGTALVLEFPDADSAALVKNRENDKATWDALIEATRAKIEKSRLVYTKMTSNARLTEFAAEAAAKSLAMNDSSISEKVAALVQLTGAAKSFGLAQLPSKRP